MKGLSVFISLMAASSAMAFEQKSQECADYLERFQDSRAFSFPSNYATDLNLTAAKNTIEELLKAHCTVEDLNIDIKNEKANNCSFVIPRNPNSYACYLESDVGYFFVTGDLLDNIFVIWNRWD